MTTHDVRVPMVQLLSPEGDYGVPTQYAEYGKYIEALKEEDFLKFYRDMARMGHRTSAPGSAGSLDSGNRPGGCADRFGLRGWPQRPHFS
jgi:hypothetical protein